MWMRKGLRYVFMDQATDGTGSSGGSMAADTAEASTNESGGAGDSGSTTDGTAGENNGSPDGSASGNPAGSTPEGTALAQGQSQQTVAIPEKYQVKKEDGTLDLEASSLKLAEAYGNLEKRIGTGDLPPKTADDYAIAVPDALKEFWKPESDEIMKDFKAEAHAKGLTQGQFDFVMSRYFQIAPQLVNGAQALSADDCTTELKAAWKTDAEYKAGVGNAYKAAVGYPLSNNASYGGSGQLLITPNGTTKRKTIDSSFSYFSAASTPQKIIIGGAYDGDNGAINAVRFKFASGNIADGSIYMYGVQKS